MPDEAAGELKTLAEQVRQARQAARLSIDAAAKVARMSPVTWTRVENALPVRPLSYAGVEQVLGWAPGSCAAILAGGAPTAAAGATRSDAATVAIRKIVEVLDFRGIGDSMRIDTIRGIVANYQREVAQPNDEQEQRLAAG